MEMNLNIFEWIICLSGFRERKVITSTIYLIQFSVFGKVTIEVTPVWGYALYPKSFNNSPLTPSGILSRGQHSLSDGYKGSKLLVETGRHTVKWFQT